MVAFVGHDRVKEHGRSLFQAFRRRRYRTQRQWAEEELVIPTGEHVGKRFRVDRQPIMEHWFREVDSGNYSEFVAVGPSQSGKSLQAFIIPICYHLFEIQETVVAAIPSDDMIRDKWEETLLPVIERTRYRDLLPVRGAGSKGGTTKSIKFRNGTTLRWMTAGGGEKSRSHFTTRVICFTETDGFDDGVLTGDEGTKISQIEARAFSYPVARRRIYKECTVSRDTKETWVRYEAGTNTRILLPCVHCGEHVLPERDSLVGWQDAQSEEDARQRSSFACPACGELWNEHQRIAACHRSVACHKGQHVDKEGRCHGEAFKTRCLGFRWSAVHNVFLPAGDHGAEEWKAPRGKQPDLDERKLRQFVWAVPVTDDLEAIELTSETVIRRTEPMLTKGIIPDDSQTVGLGVDCGKRLLHWTLSSRRTDSWHAVDYGRIEVPSDDIPIARALRIAFQELAESVNALAVPFDQACVDIRYLPEEILAAIASLEDDRWMGHIGLGDNHYLTRGNKYRHPEAKSKMVRYLGTRWYLKRRDKGKREVVAYSDACYWKGVVQKGFASTDTDDRITLYQSTDKNEHVTFGKHITAEREEIEFEPGKGHVRKWVTLSRSNHLLDSTYMSLVAHKVYSEKPRPRVVKRRRVVR